MSNKYLPNKLNQLNEHFDFDKFRGEHGTKCGAKFLKECIEHF